MWVLAAAALASPALAQQGSPGGGSAAQQPGINAPSPPLQSTSAARGSFVPALAADQSLASKLQDRSVLDRQNERVGAVSDFVVNPDGRIEAVVLAVGGFLGIGQKKVAIPFSDLKEGKSGSTDVFVVDHTEEQLRDAPAFDPNAPRP